MSKPAVHHKTPERRELAKKHSELSDLELRLAQRELDLTALQATLRAFEMRYIRVVGRLYAELDELLAHLAELEARRNPQRLDLGREAIGARIRATESATTLRATSAGDDQPDELNAREDLKLLYREIAKRIHPDLTTDERERERRTRLMAAANRAYTRADSAALQAILNEWESSPDSVPGEGIAADLIRTIRKIDQATRRLDEIAILLADLTRSELNVLMNKVESIQRAGRDLLEEMADQLNNQIARARARINELAATEPNA